jgi:predicted HicB family RNase H-like nuclease
MTTALEEKPKNKGGRPPLKGGPRVQLNTRTQKKTRDRLKKQADRRGVSVSYMVEWALQDSLGRWEDEELPVVH